MTFRKKTDPVSREYWDFVERTAEQVVQAAREARELTAPINRPPVNCIKCVKHPRYKAARQPRIACYGCWLKWFYALGYVFIDDLWPNCWRTDCTVCKPSP